MNRIIPLQIIMDSVQLRCKQCGFWNTPHSAEAKCESCGAKLYEVSEADKQSLIRRKTAGELTLPILPEDSFWRVVGKKIYNAVTIIFLAITSFFLWLFAAGPG